MKIHNSITLILITLLLGASANASQSKPCNELPRSFLKLFLSIIPPEAGLRTAEVNAFCNSNPHEFGMTSASYKEPKIKPKCYRSKNSEIVLEIPNIYFNDCRDQNYFESLLNHYAYKLATLSDTPFEMIVYNKKHRFYEHGDFNESHEIFERVKIWKLFENKMRYIKEKIDSKEYSREDIACVFELKNIAGEPCPADLSLKFTDPLTIDMIQFQKR